MRKTIIATFATLLLSNNFAKAITVESDSISDDEIEQAIANIQLQEVEVSATGISPVSKSSFNAISISTAEALNSSKSLSDILAKAPGMKIRANGGEGSDTQVMMDGFSGKHVKLFIDGVPQESSGSFGLNNIPAGYAERIEVYKGVVPVGFASDAIGGVINVVTKHDKRKWWTDASYLYGSFNTHKLNASFGQNLSNGFHYDARMLFGYSDNDYRIRTHVEDFTTGAIDKQNEIEVKRFHDAYRNEAFIANFGVTGKSWADKLLFGVRYSSAHKDIQTGVRQDVVYGAKYRNTNSIVPSLRYSKRNLFTRGLNASLSAEYNRTITTNVDTSAVKYNWLGATKPLNSPGEQAYQHTQNKSNRWNVTSKFDYRAADHSIFTLSHIFSSYGSRNTSLLNEQPEVDEFDKKSIKNVTGLSYRFTPSHQLDANVFAKLYALSVNGPVLIDLSKLTYEMQSRQQSSLGYGTALSYHIVRPVQAKLSYEKAYRLPTIEEMFGDDDLEKGDADIRPECSHNVNFSINYDARFGSHSLYAEGGLIYRNTQDYIQRNIVNISGGKSTATYVNYGKVLSKGGNMALRYGYRRLINAGVNFTFIDVRDNMPTLMGSSAANTNYKERMPNVPFAFGDFDISCTLPNVIVKDSSLTLTYDNQYLHSFSYYGENIGANSADYLIPDQFSHNLAVTYSLRQGKYNLTAEVKNLTDALLYDNFHLQKAGRAFYVKFRVKFSD